MVRKQTYDYLEGRKFCVVLVQADEKDKSPEKAKLRCIRGRASIEDGKITCVGGHGRFCVPVSAYATVLPSDGNAILQDAEYYCFVRVDSRISID